MRILIDGQTLYTPEVERGIGRYFKNIIRAVLENDFTDEFFINVADQRVLANLPGWVTQKLKILTHSNYALNASHPQLDKSFLSSYVETLDSDLKKYDIDLYWNPNPLMDNVVLPEKNCQCLFAATIHDLIPIVMKDIYFKIWPKAAINMYKGKLNVLEANYDLFLCNSQCTELDLKKNLKMNDKLSVITLLSAANNFRPYPFPKIFSEENYILCVSGFDPRKNLNRTVESFARLHSRLGGDTGLRDLKLYIVCSHNEEEKDALLEYARSLGVEKKVKITGLVEESRLIVLYQKARCLFFPSLYEGFGLPVLEALACGLPVALSNTSSLPEVAGEFGVFFDPFDIEDMTDALYKALNAPMDYGSRYKRYKYSQKFSWKNAAIQTKQAFKNIMPKSSLTAERIRKKIAWVSPFPPQRSGISYYSHVLIEVLKDFFDIDLYYVNERPAESITKAFTVFDHRKLSENLGLYDEIVYHLGNNPKLHSEIYKLAWRFPGTLVLHDYNINLLMRRAFLGTAHEHLYKTALKEEQGADATQKADIKGMSEGSDVPLSRSIVKRSKKVIVHSMWAKRQFEGMSNVAMIPQFAKIAYRPTNKEIGSFRKKYGIDSRHFVISCLGFINVNKLPELLSKVIKELFYEGYPVKMVFAGELSGYLTYLKEEITNSEHAISFAFTGYQSEQDYFTAICASDIVVNLRDPSMGESSATLLHSLALGKPVMVSDVNQYMEFPDSVCWKVPRDDCEYHLYNYLKVLMNNRCLRKQLSENSLEFSKLFDVNLIAKRYADFIGIQQFPLVKE